MESSGPPLNFLTADLVDAHGPILQSCETQFRQFGGHRSFGGPVTTFVTREDNGLLKEILSRPGAGAVLVVDGGGSLRTALMGDVIASAAQANGWAGVVINGAVRDAAALGRIGIGVKALGTNPSRSGKAGSGREGITVTFGGASFSPGSWLYSDDDGIVVSPQRLH